jgi:hypothetical protein
MQYEMISLERMGAIRVRRLGGGHTRITYDLHAGHGADSLIGADGPGFNPVPGTA